MRRFAVGVVLAGLALGLVSGSRVARSQTRPKSTKAAVPSYGNVDSIGSEEMKIYLYFLASDQLEGRNLPSRGLDTAALYIASHLAEWGLKPGGSTEKTVGPLQPYFMPMELVSRSVVPADSSLSLTAPQQAGRGGRGGGMGAPADGTVPLPRTTAFDYGKDWTAATGGRGAAQATPIDAAGNLVFVGNGYVVNKSKLNPWDGLEVKGKIAIVAGLPSELAAESGGGRGRGGRGAAGEQAPAGETAAASLPSGRPDPQAPNPLGEACKDFLTPEQAAAKNGALAVITVANFQQAANLANPNAAPTFGGFGGGGRANLNGPTFIVPKLETPSACPAVPSVTAGLALTNAFFQGEKSNGAQVFAAATNNSKLDSFELASSKKLALKVAVKTESGHSQNIIGILEGADPVLKNEYVVISAHPDHIGFAAPLPDGHNINNGADDDGSGCAGLLALARSYAEGAAKGIRPKRSIVFAWLAGEEKGLWGSQYFTQYPFLDMTKVVADLNMDMIGRTKGPGFTDSDKTHVLVDPGEILIVGPQISSADLEKTIETVNDGYLKLKLNHFYDTTAPDATHDNLGPPLRGQRIFYRSDHYNFAKLGIPIAFFTTGLHPDYHRATDTPDKIDYQEMQIVSKTMGAVAWVLATQPGRPKVNERLPDQLLKDMKEAREQGWGKITPVIPPPPGMPY
jgi:Zn-dependent M28 family amino/carboxypeptidase